MEGTGIASVREHQFPVRYWITVSADRRGRKGRGKLEMPSMEAVRLVDNSQFTLQLENGGSFELVVTATGSGPVLDVESIGPIPGYEFWLNP